MTALSSDTTARVAKLLPRLASDQQGEVAAVAAALTRTLKSGGCDLHDLAAHVAEGPREIVVYRSPEPPAYTFGAWAAASRRPTSNEVHRARVARCQQVGGARLSDWETSFLSSIALRLARAQRLTDRQAATLDDIAGKLGVRT